MHACSFSLLQQLALGGSLLFCAGHVQKVRVFALLTGSKPLPHFFGRHAGRMVVILSPRFTMHPG
jgi:hypothetical protein